ncbi:hypothetical protein LPTSP4_30070 [Leptospira ryugenii]|uniref:Tim44-like domain-containing protein n=1 Tax=Leptospira ryugenii TaxID=1917863 RepID=A0A2P2E3N2_9LEPT|nr:hypothetical protein LPTSP4_30070 [Leptospira ryugenii]
MKNSAKVGIKRKNFSQIGDWEIKDLQVKGPFASYAIGTEIIIPWPEGTNKENLLIELEYTIANAVEDLGGFQIVLWELNQKDADKQNSQLDISWDDSIQWKQFQIKQKFYDQSKEDYGYETVAFETDKQRVAVSFQNLRNDFIDFTLTAFPESNLNLAHKKEINPNEKFYYTQEKVRVEKNMSNHYEGYLYTKESDTFAYHTIVFNPELFLDEQIPVLDPAYQFIYNISDGLETSFWHLFSLAITLPPEKERIDGSDFNRYHFQYSILGEHKRPSDTENHLIYLRPIVYGGGTGTRMGSMAMEIQMPKAIDLKTTKIGLYVTDCNYCSRVSFKFELPAEIGIDQNKIFVNWPHTIPEGMWPIIKVETQGDTFTKNYLLQYICMLRSFFLAPGSGSNIGYLIVNTLLLLLPLTIAFIYLNHKKRIIVEKRSFQKLTKLMQDTDPDFTWEEFFQKTKLIAERVVDAWCQGNMESARPFISAGVFQRFQIQLKLMAEVDGSKNHMENFSVKDQSIVLHTSFHGYQTIHVKMKCAAKDITLPTDTPESQIKERLRSSQLGTYEEIYSFSRRIDAQTVKGQNLFHNVCPSCGANTELSHTTTKCSHCGTIFNSGEADWVLSEITQVIEWKPNRFVSEESFAKNHPNLPTSIQIIEDRASALLWKWMYAKTKANDTYLLREVSSTEALQSVRNQEYFYTPAVGASEIKEIQTKQKATFTNVVLHWSAARSLKASPEYRQTNLILKLHDERDERIGFSEISCKQCGAPFPEVDASSCSYCGSPIPKQLSDWLLDSIK